MSKSCRVLKHGLCEITQAYWNSHKALDLVGANYTLDDIVAHSDGTVVAYRNNYATNDKTGNSYGNYVKIKHDNDYYTLYAHMVYQSVKVKPGDKVKKGQVLGAMGNTGHSFGAHLHFEVYRGNQLINPTKYLTEDLPNQNYIPNTKLKYEVGNIVNINKVYVSSESVNPLTPKIKTGTITKIIEGARNPYLLNGGDIGWVNDGCIVTNKIYKTVVNCSYLNLRTSSNYGNNIYTSVKAGTKLEYLGIVNGWAQVIYNNKTLYCGSSYLR